ncbi:MAG TPA: MaoC family dehydratase [Hyphomicrobiaceae bacterium]|nr:MaoC family dehydratase [Hyphomicrobiaceae bacterium]
MSNYFEDLEIGKTIELGSHTFTREEIIDFAKKYDPQPFHLDDAAAERSLFKRLSASGWHTAAVWLRLMVDARNRQADIIRFRGERPARYGPSPGFEELKWVKPVFVGDTIRFTTRVIEKRDSRSRPEVGLIVYQNEGFNQAGDLVFSLRSKIFVERRAPLAILSRQPAGERG